MNSTEKFTNEKIPRYESLRLPDGYAKTVSMRYHHDLSVHDLLFFCGYGIWVFSSTFVVTVSGSDSIYTWCKICALSFWLLAALFSKWKRTDVVKLIMFVVLSMVIFLQTKNIDVLVISIAVFAMYKISIYAIAKFDLLMRTLSVLMTIGSHYLGFSPGNDLLVYNRLLPIRYALGFFHPNNLFSQIFAICCAFLIVFSKRLSIFLYSLLIFCVIFFGLLTQSRTGLLVLCITIVSVAIRKLIFSSHNFCREILHYSFIICFIISFVATVWVSKNNIISKLDVLMSGRFEFAHRVFSLYGMRPFGQYIPYESTLSASNSGSIPLVVDNYYMYTVITFGLVYTVVLLYQLTKEIGFRIDKGEIVLAIVLSSYALYLMSEKSFASLTDQFIILVLCHSFYCKPSFGNTCLRVIESNKDSKS